MKATILDTGDIRLGGDVWSETFPASELPKRLNFYTTMRDRFGHDSYVETVKELNRCQSEM